MNGVVPNIIRAVFCVQFFESALAALGIVWLVIEFTNFLWPDNSAVSVLRQNWWFLAATIVLYGVVRSWPISKISRKISNSDIEIRVVRGDVFKHENPLIIGAPTTFDVSLNDDIISVHSMQGRYATTYFSSPDDLERQMREVCADLTPIREIGAEHKPYGPRLVYQRGEAVCIKNPQRNAYFVPLATLNRHKTAQLEVPEYVEALSVMWSSIRDKGDYSPIDMSLIGAGFSRLNLDRKAILVEIVASFVAASKSGKFTDQLNIVIRDQDFTRGSFTFELIEKILESECGLLANRSEVAGDQNIGTAVSSTN